MWGTVSVCLSNSDSAEGDEHASHEIGDSHFPIRTHAHEPPVGPTPRLSRVAARVTPHPAAFSRAGQVRVTLAELCACSVAVGACALFEMLSWACPLSTVSEAKNVSTGSCT